MEKAILKTLIYADIFNYPLKAWEIHKWLIGKKGNLRQVEKVLRRKNLESRILSREGYFILSERKKIIRERISKERQSVKYLRTAKLIGLLFKLIPWIKLVGISGGLAMNNVTKKDDIDLFVITSQQRLFLSRILMLILLEVIGKRRKREETTKQVAGKVCINLLLEENSLAFQNKDIYLAHEVLQMKPIWQKDGIYTKFLQENNWTFKFLPNWLSSRGPAASVSQVRPHSLRLLRSTLESSPSRHPSMFDYLEKIARWLQLRYMGKPKGEERIETNALYFHPNDCRPKILKTYVERTKKLTTKR